MNNPSTVTNKKTNTNQDDQSFIYYNVFIRGTPEGKPASFTENRVVPILNDPSLYELTVIRFSVSSFNIPISFYDDSQYIKLQYQGTTILKNLQYIEPASAGLPEFYTPKQPIYQFSTYVQSLNIALQEAFDDLLVLEPTIPATEPPFMTFEPATGLFTMNAEKAGYDEDLGLNKVDIIFSYNLFKQYNSFENFFLNPDETRIIIRDTFTNSTIFNGQDYYFMTQSYSTLENISTVTRLVFLSNSIPVNQELLGFQNDVQQRQITDFLLEGVTSRGDIIFTPRGPLRYYDLLSNYPLRQIDLNVRFQTDDGETYPVILTEGTNVSVKIQFRKKISERLLQNGL